MDTVDRLAALLPDAAEALQAKRHSLREVRLRVGRPVQIISSEDAAFTGEKISEETMKRLVASLTDHSLYAREEELKQGFFTLTDGARVGVCGRMACAGGEIAGMGGIGSLCVRVAREVRGCADALVPLAGKGETLRSLLIASPPGMGKTTCLRDLARQLSDQGWRVGIADERHELAACCRAVPTLDVGAGTDVMDGAPKHLAIRHMLRAMAPQIIVTDEIGDARDAEVLADAARCGVAVVASAHGRGYDALMEREPIRRLIEERVFQYIVVLGGVPGRILDVRSSGEEEGGLCRCG